MANTENTQNKKSGEETKRINKGMIKEITTLALLSAMIIVLQLLGPSLTPIFKVSISFALIPITIGAIVYGPKGGAILGGVFGIMTVVNGLTGADAFTASLISIAPIGTVVLCLVKATAAGVMAGLMYKLVRKKSLIGATFTAAATAPIVNTGIFVAGSLTVLSDAVVEAAATLGITGQSVATLVIITLAGVNFLAEFGVNLLFATAIKTIVEAVQKSTAKK